MRRSKYLALALVVAMLALTAGIYTGIQAQDAPKPEPALPQEAISHIFATRLNNTDGKTQDFAQWRGKTLVINFWATWCPPCREEMPEFSRLQTKYAAKGVQFIGIALDTSVNVRNYSNQHPASYPLIVADADGAELTRKMGNSSLALPYTVVIDSKDKPQLTRLGRISEQELDALLLKITGQ